MSGYNTAYHIVIRPTERFVTIHGRKVDIIEEHNRVINAEGKVAFGKLGRRLAPSRVRHLQKQASGGQTPYIYFVFKNRGGFVGYRAPITHIEIAYANSRPPATYPKYYDYLNLIPSLWFVLSRSFRSSPLDGLYLLSNQRRLLDVLPKTPAAMILVKKGAQKVQNSKS